jgi:hypothetical protein
LADRQMSRARSMTRSRPLLLALVSGISGNGPSRVESRGVAAQGDRQ